MSTTLMHMACLPDPIWTITSCTWQAYLGVCASHAWSVNLQVMMVGQKQGMKLQSHSMPSTGAQIVMQYEGTNSCLGKSGVAIV